MGETSSRSASFSADRLLATIPAAVVSFDDSGRITYANDTLLTLLGYERTEVEGRHVESLLMIPGRIFFQTHLYPVVRLHGAASEMFVLLRHKSGHDVGVLLNAARRPDGDLWSVDCVMMEVRERRKFEDALLRAKQAAEQATDEVRKRSEELEDANGMLEAQALELEMQQQTLEEQSEELTAINEALEAHGIELERARDAADEANAAKSQFLAVMSHELRTPLNAIGGYVQLIELGIHGDVTDAQRDALGRIARAQRHLLRLINDVLNLARIEAGRVEYVQERVRVAELIRNVLPMVEPQLLAGGLNSRSDVPEDLVAIADIEKVQQILINLLTNAVKFTAPGGTISVEADAAGDVVRLRVVDSGIGIPEEKLTSIFQPFVQVEMEHARRKEGSGLGLAISRDLARGMGGDLSVESRMGKGSVFTLWLRKDVAMPG